MFLNGMGSWLCISSFCPEDDFKITMFLLSRLPERLERQKDLVVPARIKIRCGKKRRAAFYF